MPHQFPAFAALSLPAPCPGARFVGLDRFIRISVENELAWPRFLDVLERFLTPVT